MSDDTVFLSKTNIITFACWYIEEFGLFDQIYGHILKKDYAIYFKDIFEHIFFASTFLRGSYF